MKKILIIGGAGFIGSHVAKELITIGHKVIIYDNFSNFISPQKGHYPFYLQKRLAEIGNDAEIIHGDIRDKKLLTQTIRYARPNVVVNLVAIPLATASTVFFEDAVRINLDGHINLLEAMRVTDSVQRVIYASSSFVYGNFEYEPADESKHPTRPIDVYGGTKLSCEILTKVYGERFGIEYTIIRPSAVYGPTDANLRVSQIFVQNAFLNIPLILFDGGKNKIDFTYVTDTAHGFVLAALSPNGKNQIFNITAGRGRTPEEFTQTLKKLLPEKHVSTVIKESDTKRPSRGALDISKANRLLGYKPEYQLEEGLKKYVEYIKSVNLFS